MLVEACLLDDFTSLTEPFLHMGASQGNSQIPKTKISLPNQSIQKPPTILFPMLSVRDAQANGWPLLASE